MRPTNDEDFYDRRAADIQSAADKGDLDTAAHLIAHAVLEEGPGAYKHLTAANNRRNGKS